MRKTLCFHVPIADSAQKMFGCMCYSFVLSALDVSVSHTHSHKHSPWLMLYHAKFFLVAMETPVLAVHRSVALCQIIYSRSGSKNVHCLILKTSSVVFLVAGKFIFKTLCQTDTFSLRFMCLFSQSVHNNKSITDCQWNDDYSQGLCWY